MTQDNADSGQTRARDPRWEAYLEQIRKGATERAACALVKLSRSTLSEWVKDEEMQAEEDLARETYLAEVRERVEAVSRGDGIDTKDDAARARATLAASTWLLEKREPDRFGKREAREISGPKGAPLQVQGTAPERALTADEQLASFDVLERRIAESRAAILAAKKGGGT